MKSYALPAVTLGLDVVTPEGSLRDGAVRVANNVLLHNDGSIEQRQGYAQEIALPNAHSIWKSPAQTRPLAAAGGTLYGLDFQAGAAGALFSGLPPYEPVSYTDVGPDIYFTAPGVLRKIDPYGVVRRPGVMDSFPSAPTAAATAGGLYPGRYGVAYSVFNDLGEESPISGIAWIDLPSGGGITLSALQSASDAVAIGLYVTAANGGDLYHHGDVAMAASASITDQAKGRRAERQYLQPMPGGSIVRLYNGRLYVVDRKTVWCSEPLDYGVSSVKNGWMTFKRTITMFEPVRGGIFVGMRERTLFLGGAHEEFTVTVIPHGALPGDYGQMPADYFAPELVPDRSTPVAVWLSEVGLAIGRPDGSVIYPQADRVRLEGGDSRLWFMHQGGIKQNVFCVTDLTTATANDLTI